MPDAVTENPPESPAATDPPYLLTRLKSSSALNKLSRIRFAPFNVPLPRRRQTAAVALWASFGPLCLLLCIFLAIHSSLRVVLVVYFAYILFDNSPVTGGRRVQWLRELKLWKWVAEYFPVTLLRENELDTERNYIFGYHPHGILCVGAFTAFATEAAGYSQLFPGIVVRLLTLDINFKIPFYRDYALGMGLASVSRKSCEHILTKTGPGHSCMIVVGGAAESLYAFQSTHYLVLKRRMGFIRLALRTGASLVPVYGFGENDVYRQIRLSEESALRRLQLTFKRLAGWTLPAICGRGLFNYDIGILPFRHPIFVVTGNPIHVTKTDDPSDEEVQRVHTLYVEELQRVFEKYKNIYARDRKSDMQLVE